MTLEAHKRGNRDIFGEPIELLYQGIKSPVTRAKYTEILRRVLCEALGDLLGVSLSKEQTACNRIKTKPGMGNNSLTCYCKKTKGANNASGNYKNYLTESNYYC
jgi:hypothetical protein